MNLQDFPVVVILVVYYLILLNTAHHHHQIHLDYHYLRLGILQRQHHLQ
jgi:hypothetical protein